MKLRNSQSGLAHLLLISLLLFAIITGIVGWRIYAAKTATKRNPDGSLAVKAEPNVRDTVESLHSDIAEKMDLAYLDTSFADVCYGGQNNFKRKDGYTNRCALQVNKFYGVKGDFRTTILKLEETLLSSGWSEYSRPNPFTYVIEEYYDERYGTLMWPTDPPRPFSVSELPFSPNDFKRQSKIEHDLLGVECADKISPDISDDGSYSSLRNRQYPIHTENSRNLTTLLEPSVIFKKSQDAGYEFMCMISIVSIYHSEKHRGFSF